jgi:RNA polymerase sigma factor (sigma-70 family)
MVRNEQRKVNQQRSPEEYQAVYAKYRSEVWGLAHALCGYNTTDADDLAQNTFFRLLRVWQRLPLLDENEFRAYLLRTLRNTVKDYKKSAVRRLTKPWNGHVLQETLVASESDPETALENQEQVEELHRALAALPEDYRFALLLKYEAGMTYKEIANVLGRSARAVQQLLARARAALYTQLEQLEPGNCPRSSKGRRPSQNVR